MSLIRDVREGIRGLDVSPKSLRRFGLLVGGVFLLLALLAVLKEYSLLFRYIAGALGVVLVCAGIAVPTVLRGVYLVWMGAALAIGWFVSRFLLIVIFYTVLTPIGFLARLYGKNFMDIDMREKKNTYWVKRDSARKMNYEKMY